MFIQHDFIIVLEIGTLVVYNYFMYFRPENEKKGYEKMNNLFKGFGEPVVGQQPPQEEYQKPAAVQAKGPSDSERKAYAAYRQAVSSYGKLTADRSRAVSDMEQLEKQKNVFPIQLNKLQKELITLEAEKKGLETEVKKQQQGGTGAVLQVKNVQCDAQTAAMIREARDKGWMTASQLEFMDKPCEDVCKTKALSNVENVESLERTFQGTNLYTSLVNCVVGPETVRQALGKFFVMFSGGLFAALVLARLTDWSFLVTISNWICSVFFAGLAGACAFFKLRDKGFVVSAIGALLIGIIGWNAGTLICMFVLSGGFIISTVLALLVCGAIAATAAAICSSKAVLPYFQNMEFVKGTARKEAFQNSESVELMNEALYCYCNHNAIMDYLRNNARQNWIVQLNADIREKMQQVDRKKQEIQEVQNKVSRITAQLQAAKEQVLAAGNAIISANRSIRAWQGQPDMEMANSQFADMICMESGTENSLDIVINHGKKPVVFYYNGDATLMNPAGQVVDQLAYLINGFTKMNPAGLMQVSLIDMVGGAISLSMDSRFRFVDWSEMKNYTSDDPNGDIFRVGNREELREFQQQLDAHCKSLQNYTNKHREQLQGRSGIEQVNKLRAQEGQKPFRYQVMVILVPREDDRDELGQESVMSYLQDTNISVPYGILPVFFVNESSIHKRWKPTIGRCKENQLRIKVR